MLPKCRSGWKSAGKTCYQSVADGRDGRAEHATKVSQMAGMDGRNMLPKCRRWQGWTGETCYLSVAVGGNRARRWSKIGAKGVKNRCEGGEKSAEIARKAAKIE